VEGLNNLLDSIEEFRRRMHEIAEGKSLTDPIVIEFSRDLDILLNQYYAGLRNNEVCGIFNM
jgi:Spo0E like sporulation regulatory protein.